MDKAHKEDMRHLAYSKENHTSEEIAQLKEYCLEDGYMTKRLYCAMLPHLDLLRAPLRAAFMMEIERIRWAGIPIDMPTYRRFKQHAPAIGSKLALSSIVNSGSKSITATFSKSRPCFA